MLALFIDIQKLKKNIQITKSCAGQAHIIGVIKGNGYGLGLCTYAHILIQSGIEILAVTEIGDAVTLRNSGITCDIMLLSPLYRKEDLAQALSYHVILCISSFHCGEMIEQIAIERNMYARAQICVDTGLGRYGFPDTHTLPAGHHIGYGQTFTTRRKTTVAVVPAGYSHGLETKRNNDCPGITQLPRYIYHLLKNTLFPKQLCAYRGDTAFPVLGKIGMTNVIIDITGYNIKIGDIVSFPINPIYVDSSIPRIYS